MTFRTRLVLLFTAAVIASVGTVEWFVTRSTRRTYERIDARRAALLATQFQKEYERRGVEIVRAVTGIANSEATTAIAADPDPARYHDDAAQLASSQGLDLLELVAGDGSIVSSAEWPARFGYKEDWLTAPHDWKSLGAFLRREELPDGVALALVAVATTVAGDRRLFIAGGQKLDTVLSSLALPEGTRALLYRVGAIAENPSTLAPLEPLIKRVLRERRPIVDTAGQGAESETVHAFPLNGYEGDPLAVLLIGSSRRDLMQLESSLLRSGVWVAVGGILVGLALSWWATARVTRPVRLLAHGAAKVAGGNWAATVRSGSKDEIGQLAQAFNRMTKQLVEQRDRLVQAERVAAWRELARRLAHELKNPLFPLQITIENMQRARENYPDQFDEVFREGAATLLTELSNLKQIVGRFSDFAKMPAPEMQPVNFSELAGRTLKLFEAQLAEAKIEARAELDPNLPAVQADPEQMTRVLRNLVLNAIDAMPEGGRLTVRTLAAEGGVRIEISDTGQGLTPEECARLFTPYYTTKTHGTGLGLAIVQSTVADHKGRISVDSQPGRGTTFRIELG